MKRLVLLTVILLVAVPVFAQGPQFQTGSANPTLRSEGLTEAVGNVSLVVTSAAGTIPAGSSITLTYTSTVTNASSINVTTGNPVSVSPGGVCTAAATPALCPDNVTASGNQVTLTYTTARAFAAGDVVVVSGIRVNANAVGQGGSVFVNLSTNPAIAASFTNAGPLPVGTVFNNLSTTVALTPVAGTNLVCQAAGGTVPATAQAFTVSVAENFGSALTSNTDEIALSNIPGPTNGSQIRITFSALPAGVVITPGVLPAGLSAVAGATATVFTFVPTPGAPTNTGAIDTYAIPFTVTWPGALPAGSAGNITATVALAPISTTAGTIVRFASNTQGSGTVVTLTDCVTTLYFPFIAADVAGFDTSVSISNSTKDTDETGAAIFPANIGATPQAGTCKFVGYKTPSLAAPGTIVATPVTFTTPSIAAGGTWATSLGTTAAFGGDPAVLNDGVAGYAFATCNFLNAHGFAFITNGFGGTTTISHGYIPLVVPRNASRVAAGGEALNN